MTLAWPSLGRGPKKDRGRIGGEQNRVQIQGGICSQGKVKWKDAEGVEFKRGGKRGPHARRKVTDIR